MDTTVEEGRATTRAGLLRALAGGGAVAFTAGIAGRRLGGAASLAASPSRDQDAEILGVLLTLERIQQRFYAAALETGRLDGDLADFARAAEAQERAHVAFLAHAVGRTAPEPPETDFTAATSSADAFTKASIELEEAAIATYVGQGANLTRGRIADVAAMTAVEARQAAWIRDIAGLSAAPAAADAAKAPAKVFDELRAKGMLR